MAGKQRRSSNRVLHWVGYRALLAVAIAEAATGGDYGGRAAATAATGKSTGATDGILRDGRAVVESIAVKALWDVLVLEDTADDELGVVVPRLRRSRSEYQIRRYGHVPICEDIHDRPGFAARERPVVVRKADPHDVEVALERGSPALRARA